ncbi:MAG: hypothetical protein EAZ87_02850 [Nostocales cyanobacterium]|nr:MAG: hypothetical protein EAZ87_02850 [Nostocales cyanobacterium]
MHHKNILQQIQNSHEILQKNLNQGWQEFKETATFNTTKQLSQTMNWWYDSQFYNIIPNPAHWYASQLAAKYFLIEIGKLGIYFDTVFPGDFSQSKEFVREDGLDVRIFELTAFHQTQPICIFQLEFIHNHEKFYFTYPPQLRIIEKL